MRIFFNIVVIVLLQKVWAIDNYKVRQLLVIKNKSYSQCTLSEIKIDNVCYNVTANHCLGKNPKYLYFSEISNEDVDNHNNIVFRKIKKRDGEPGISLNLEGAEKEELLLVNIYNEYFSSIKVEEIYKETQIIKRLPQVDLAFLKPKYQSNCKKVENIESSAMETALKKFDKNFHLTTTGYRKFQFYESNYIFDKYKNYSIRAEGNGETISEWREENLSSLEKYTNNNDNFQLEDYLYRLSYMNFSFGKIIKNKESDQYTFFPVFADEGQSGGIIGVDTFHNPLGNLPIALIQRVNISQDIVMGVPLYKLPEYFNSEDEGNYLKNNEINYTRDAKKYKELYKKIFDKITILKKGKNKEEYLIKIRNRDRFLGDNDLADIGDSNKSPSIDEVPMKRKWFKKVPDLEKLFIVPGIIDYFIPSPEGVRMEGEDNEVMLGWKNSDNEYFQFKGEGDWLDYLDNKDDTSIIKRKKKKGPNRELREEFLERMEGDYTSSSENVEFFKSYAAKQGSKKIDQIYLRNWGDPKTDISINGKNISISINPFQSVHNSFWDPRSKKINQFFGTIIENDDKSFEINLKPNRDYSHYTFTLFNKKWTCENINLLQLDCISEIGVFSISLNNTKNRKLTYRFFYKSPYKRSHGRGTHLYPEEYEYYYGVLNAAD